MKSEAFNIGSTPALLIGEQSDKVFLFVHGLHGRKEEAWAFAEVAVPKGYQVLGIDLPVERKPWEVLLLLDEVRDYLYQNWKSVSIRANSIGSWHSMIAFQGKKVERALIVSPLLDMRKFIEEQTSREEDYYEWVINNPITQWDTLTYILRPENDLVVSEAVGSDFISQHRCHVTIMPDGEHWFHTPEQLAFLEEWEEKVLSVYQYVTLRERPDLKDSAAAWFHGKWRVPEAAYLECMEAYLGAKRMRGLYRKGVPRSRYRRQDVENGR